MRTRSDATPATRIAVGEFGLPVAPMPREDRHALVPVENATRA